MRAMPGLPSAHVRHGEPVEQDRPTDRGRGVQRPPRCRHPRPPTFPSTVRGARRGCSSRDAETPRIGHPDEARTELATAVAMLGEMGMASWLPEAERELAGAGR
jgi:hypothetical protein